MTHDVDARRLSTILIVLYILVILPVTSFCPFKINTAYAEHIESITQLSTAYKIAKVVTDSTNLYVAGTVLNETSSTVHDDAFIRKYDVDMNEIWTKQFGTSSSDKITGLAWYSSAIYVVGSVDGQFLSKFDDNDGDLIWTINLTPPAGGSITLNAVAVESTGIYVAGTVLGLFPDQSSPPAQSGVPNGFVQKYDLSGNEVWTKQFAAVICCGSTIDGDPVLVLALGLGLDSTGVYVVGRVGTDGLIDGSVLEPLADDHHSFVRKYDKEGNHQWTKQFGSTSRGTSATDVATNFGLVFVTGGSKFAGGFVQTYDVDGHLRWGTGFGGMNLAIAADSSGVYIGGFNEGFISDTHHGIAAKLSTDGEFRWFRDVIGSGSSDSREDVTDVTLMSGSAFFVGNSDTGLFGAPTPGGAFILRIGSDDPITYNLNLFEGSDPSDLLYNLGQEARAVADTTDPVVTQVTFRWIDPGGNIDTEIVPLSLTGQAEDTFTPDEGGTWTIEADFGNGVVIQRTLNIDFLVIPESPIGTIVLILSSIAALSTFAVIKNSQVKK